MHSNRHHAFVANDRYLAENKGKLAEEAVRDELGTICKVVLPDFSECPLQKEFSDRKDFTREIGIRNKGNNSIFKYSVKAFLKIADKNLAFKTRIGLDSGCPHQPESL